MTGVQTCALPIYPAGRGTADRADIATRRRRQRHAPHLFHDTHAHVALFTGRRIGRQILRAPGDQRAGYQEGKDEAAAHAMRPLPDGGTEILPATLRDLVARKTVILPAAVRDLDRAQY